jgi:antitoxin FitA
MSKMIQVRNVLDGLHRKLKVRAAEEGVSMSDYILAELRRLADRPSLRASLSRRGSPTRDDLTPSPDQILRGERDRRS